MLDGYLRRTVETGDLLVEVSGRERRYGDGTGPTVAVRLTPAAALKIALNPDLKLGECFMDGELRFEQGDMLALLELVARNPRFWNKEGDWLEALRRSLVRRLFQANGRSRARRNVAHHYDLSYDLYSRFLDADMQYSCAYFARPDMTLEEAQQAKITHIASKLDLPEHGRVLDIGCGWGGLGLALARTSPGLEVTGVTLSQEQLAVARRRAQAQGLSARCDFRLSDYRDVRERFDRIVSVGMFEHVGRTNFQEYFDTLARLLDEGGVAVVHAIGRSTPPGVTQPFIAKYIFPGGYIASLSEVLPAVERAKLWVSDLEVLRLHYAETLRAWRLRFEAHRAEIRSIYDERFCRMWDVYLAFSEAGFRWFGMMVFQIQLTRRVDALPLTRDYMAAAERRLANEGQPTAANQSWAQTG